MKFLARAATGISSQNVPGISSQSGHGISSQNGHPISSQNGHGTPEMDSSVSSSYTVGVTRAQVLSAFRPAVYEREMNSPISRSYTVGVTQAQVLRRVFCVPFGVFPCVPFGVFPCVPFRCVSLRALRCVSLHALRCVSLCALRCVSLREGQLGKIDSAFHPRTNYKKSVSGGSTNVDAERPGTAEGPRCGRMFTQPGQGNPKSGMSVRWTNPFHAGTQWAWTHYGLVFEPRPLCTNVRWTNPSQAGTRWTWTH